MIITLISNGCIVTEYSSEVSPMTGERIELREDLEVTSYVVTSVKHVIEVDIQAQQLLVVAEVKKIK